MNIKEIIPILIPLILLQMGLTIYSLIHVFTHKNYQKGNRLIWALISLISIIGPILYFSFGRADE